MIAFRSRTSHKFLVLAFAALAFTTGAAHGQGKPAIVAKVDALQVPAWVERGGVRASVKAGWAIYAGDKLFTGPEGRLQLGLPGDGKLKLSGDSEIEFGKAVGTDAPLFDVRGGTFQLTAAMVDRGGPGGTLIGLNGKATANVRGGQVVGREDALCLVDGAAAVTGSGGSVALNQAQTVVSVTPAGKPLAPIAMAPERLAQWVGSVQPVGGKPSLKAEGTWDVSLNSGYNLKELETMACKVQRRGYPSEIYPVREPGKQVWYRVVVRRFGSKAEAVQFLGTARELGAKEPWVLLPQS